MTLTEMYGHNLDYYNQMLRAEQKTYEFYRDENGEVWWRHTKKDRKRKKKGKAKRRVRWKNAKKEEMFLTNCFFGE